jgi:hypothetical protein
MRSTVPSNCGAITCLGIIFLEWAAIETTILEKGRMEAHIELRGEKWVSLKTANGCACSHMVT